MTILYACAESVFSEPTEERRALYGCNKQFLAKHADELKSVFRLKRYCCERAVP